MESSQRPRVRTGLMQFSNHANNDGLLARICPKCLEFLTLTKKKRDMNNLSADGGALDQQGLHKHKCNFLLWHELDKNWSRKKTQDASCVAMMCCGQFFGYWAFENLIYKTWRCIQTATEIHKGNFVWWHLSKAEQIQDISFNIHSLTRKCRLMATGPSQHLRCHSSVDVKTAPMWRILPILTNF